MSFDIWFLITPLVSTNCSYYILSDNVFVDKNKNDTTWPCLWDTSETDIEHNLSTCSQVYKVLIHYNTFVSENQ
jgi:hypothetical protein